MVKTAEYIEKNADVFHRMVKIGAVPLSYLTYYKIYCFYKSLTKIPSKMERYTFTADSMKVSSETVRVAVRVMERTI